MNKAKYLSKLKRKAFKLWSEKVRSIGKCEICEAKKGDLKSNGKPVILNAHHIIPKQVKNLTFDIENGICLCTTHHKYDIKISAHTNSLAFYDWLKKKYPNKITYLLNKNSENNLSEFTIDFLEQKIKDLENDK